MSGIGRLWRELPGTLLLFLAVGAAVIALAALPQGGSDALAATLRWLWLPVYLGVSWGLGRHRDHPTLFTGRPRMMLLGVAGVLIVSFCVLWLAALVDAVSSGSRAFHTAGGVCTLGAAAVLKLADTRRAAKA